MEMGRLVSCLRASTRLRGCAVSATQVVLLLALVLLPAVAGAQAVSGTLLGNVTGDAGLGIPGATVTITEVNTNISSTAVTNETGYYIFSRLKDGVYRVAAEL